MFDERRLSQLFLDLARLDAPSFNERQVADAVIGFLKNMDLTVEEDGVGQMIGGNCGNLLCRVPANWALRHTLANEQPTDVSAASDLCIKLPPLVLSTHLDTVQPCIGKHVSLGDDRVFRSDGATILGADDLAGVVAILASLTILDDRKQPHRALELLFSVAEEAHLQGITHFDASRLSAREGYVLDTSGPPGAGVIAAPGHYYLKFSINGRTAHAGIAPETGVSAISTAACGIAAMHLGRIDDQTTANIGQISGGGETNIVAGQCVVTAECRSLDAGRLAEHVEHMISCMSTAVVTAGATLDVESHQSYHPYQVDREEPVVRRFTSACQAIGRSARLITTGGGSDMNVLARSGIRGMVLSCGMQRVHSCEEYLELGDLIDLTRLVLAIIQTE